MESRNTLFTSESRTQNHIVTCLSCCSAPEGGDLCVCPPRGPAMKTSAPNLLFLWCRLGCAFTSPPQTWSRSWNSWFAQATREPRCVVLCYIKRNISFTWILLLPPVAQSVWAPIAKYQGSGTLATGTYFLTILKVCSVRSMCLQGWCLLRPLSWAWRWSSSPRVFTGSFLCVYLNLSLFLLIRTHLYLLSYL